MKSLSPLVLVALVCVNLIPAAMGITDYLVRLNEESERIATIPADFRYGLPRDHEPANAQSVPVAPSATVNEANPIDER